MEELQIQEFVHRILTDEELRKELASTSDSVIMREGFSPRVAKIITRLVPHLAMEKPLEVSLAFWYT